MGHDQPADLHQPEERVRAVDVVGVRVGEHERVEPGDAARPEIGRGDGGAGVAGVEAAAIDHEISAVGPFEIRAAPAADVEDHEERRIERPMAEDAGESEGSDDQDDARDLPCSLRAAAAPDSPGGERGIVAGDEPRRSARRVGIRQRNRGERDQGRRAGAQVRRSGARHQCGTIPPSTSST